MTITAYYYINTIGVKQVINMLNILLVLVHPDKSQTIIIERYFKILSLLTNYSRRVNLLLPKMLNGGKQPTINISS